MRRKAWLWCVFSLLLALVLYALRSPVWYNFAVVGWWLFFDNISSRLTNQTTLDLLIHKHYSSFAKLFLILLLAGILLEVSASLLLGLWSYPLLWSLKPMWLMLLINLWGYLCYPLMFMSLWEMYVVMRTLVGRWWIALCGSIFMGIILWEVPNLFSLDWIYHIPFVPWSIFGLNIVIISGWSLLFLIPLYIYGLLGLIPKYSTDILRDS